MKQKLIDAHMEVAEVYSRLSTAIKLKVGCLIVKDNNVISMGYNGTPAEWDNVCEDIREDGTMVTKPEVIHAEANAIAKLAASPISGKGSSVFITHAPCLECAKQLMTMGAKEVFYRNDYRSVNGVEFLNRCGIPTMKQSGNPKDDTKK